MFALLAILGCVAPEPPLVEPPVPPDTSDLTPPEPTRLTLIAVGDMMNHLAVQRSAAQTREGFDALFSEVRDTIRTADVAFANLETPVARWGEVAPRVFNAPPALLEAMYRAGFDVLSAANNHAYDQGTRGLVETVDAIEAHAMTPLGAGGNCGLAEAPRVLVRKGVRIAWFASTDLLNLELNRGRDAPCVATLDLDRLEVALARARSFADLVVMSVHWGEEYVIEPTDRQEEAARRLVEAGADLVLGHHSHVVGPIEQVTTADGRVGWVAYGLGNFVSNQSAWYRHGVHAPSHGDPRDGLMLQVHVQHTPGHTVIGSVDPIALWAENTTVVGRRDSASPRIRVIPVQDHLAALEAELLAEQRAGRRKESGPTVARQLQQQITLLRDRLQIVADRTSERLPTETRGATLRGARSLGGSR